MEKLITENIEVAVESLFKEKHSMPREGVFVFAYKITIRNLGEHRVQLLSRSWYIIDSVGEQLEVEGEGVVGQQPVLNPGDVYRYESGTDLKTGIGTMEGHYTFLNLDTGEEFDVFIPKFDLLAKFVLN
jgi:ApaG protein